MTKRQTTHPLRTARRERAKELQQRMALSGQTVAERECARGFHGKCEHEAAS